MNIAAVLLAAGLSSRMGRPKPLLEFGGQTALARVLATCRAALPPGAANPPPLIVVLGHEAQRVRAAVDLTGVRVVLNPTPERGRSGSIRLGLGQLPDDAGGFLLFPVDCPLVAPETVRRLLAAALAPAGNRIFVPTCGPERRRGHPILVERSLVPEFLALGDDEPARNVVRRHADAVAEVAVDDPGILLDLDTPADYARALALFDPPKETR